MKRVKLMNLRFLSGALTAAVLSIGTAQAASPATMTVNLGNLSPTPAGILDRIVDPGQTFTDYLNFNLLASPLSTLVSTVTIAPFIGFETGTFSANLSSGTSPGGSLIGSVALGGSQFNLAPGAYSITVTGTALSSPAIGGSYNLMVAAPVPEPHEWAMMLAGLGLVGWAARRRKAAAEPVAEPVAA